MVTLLLDNIFFVLKAKAHIFFVPVLKAKELSYIRLQSFGINVSGEHFDRFIQLIFLHLAVCKVVIVFHGFDARLRCFLAIFGLFCLAHNSIFRARLIDSLRGG